MVVQLDMFESGTYVVYAVDYPDKTLEVFSTKAEAEEYQRSLDSGYGCAIEDTVLSHVDVDVETFWKVHAVMPEQ